MARAYLYAPSQRLPGMAEKNSWETSEWSTAGIDPRTFRILNQRSKTLLKLCSP